MDLVIRRNTLLAGINNKKLIYEGKNLVFDGTNFIDTGFAPYSEENIDKDFQIIFSLHNAVFTSMGTIINALREVTPYPGFCFRFPRNYDYVEITGTEDKEVTSKYNDKKFIIRRRNGIISLIFEDKEPFIPSLATRTIFDNHLILGCSEHNGNEKWRFFKGTIGYIRIEYI